MKTYLVSYIIKSNTNLIAGMKVSDILNEIVETQDFYIEPKMRIEAIKETIANMHNNTPFIITIIAISPID